MKTVRGARRAMHLANRLAFFGLALVASVACDSQAQTRLRATRPPVESGIWISRQEVRDLPMEGPAWDAVAKQAHLPVSNPDLANRNDPSNIRVLAKALYFVRTGEARYAREVGAACERIRGTELRADALSIGRELISYVIAADLVELPPKERESFERWLRNIQKRSFLDRTIRSTHEDRPNNWGTHAGATRLAVAAYLADTQEIERAAHVFQGWTGEEEGWHGFEFGADWWQPSGRKTFAINPRGAMRRGHPIGGVLPDDQRRGGRFRWPPPRENYVYEALQGAVSQAVMLERLGYGAWRWGDRALLRAFEWLHDQADFPAEGDDTWLPHIVNRAYARRFPAPTPSRPGKGMGFSDWTHAASPDPD